MDLNININKKKFHNNGYFKIKNFFNKEQISVINYEIMKSKKTKKYKDRNNKIRRIEKFYNKGKFLKEINTRFIILIKKILNLKVLIFKDKYNIKPPKGEGYFAHYDGIFYFINSRKQKKRGWYEYGNLFINILVAIDNCTHENGTIEIAKSDENNFRTLIKNTKNDGTPNLLKKVEKKKSFKKIKLNSGDLLVFKNTCAHRSAKNKSKNNRRILYYTYLHKKFGNHYNNYFKHKDLSKNRSEKSLSGEK